MKDVLEALSKQEREVLALSQQVKFCEVLAIKLLYAPLLSLCREEIQRVPYKKIADATPCIA